MIQNGIDILVGPSPPDSKHARTGDGHLIPVRSVPDETTYPGRGGDRTLPERREYKINALQGC